MPLAILPLIILILLLLPIFRRKNLKLAKHREILTRSHLQRSAWTVGSWVPRVPTMQRKLKDQAPWILLNCKSACRSLLLRVSHVFFIGWLFSAAMKVTVFVDKQANRHKWSTNGQLLIAMLNNQTVLDHPPKKKVRENDSRGLAQPMARQTTHIVGASISIAKDILVISVIGSI